MAPVPDVLAAAAPDADAPPPPARARGRRVALVAAALALNLGAVTWLSWPLATVITTHVAEGGLRCDTQYAAWALAWQTHALGTDPLGIADANVYAPTRHALFYGPPGFGLLPLFAPVFVATGNPTLAINLASFGGVLLAVLGLHLLVWRWSGCWTAGAVAAVVAWTTPTLTAFAAENPQGSALAPLPALVLAGLASAYDRRALLALIPLAVLQCAADLVYVTPATLAPLGVLALVRIARPATRAAGLRLAAALGLVAVALSPIAWGYAAVRHANPNLAAQTVWTLPPRASAVAWATATYLPWTVRGLVLAGLAARIVAGRREAARTPAAAWGHALLWWLSGALLVAWLPDVARALLPDMPLIRGNGRLGMCAIAGIAIAAGLAFAECVAAWVRWRRGMAVATLVLLVAVVAGLGIERRPLLRRTHLPYPGQHPTAAEVEMLRAEQGPVLELPVGGHGDVWLQSDAMYRSIWHWRPMVNGYASYYPAAFPARMALARRLPDAEAMAALRRDTGVTTVLVRLAGMGRVQRDRWEAAARASWQHGLLLRHRSPWLLVFGVAP